MDDDRRGGLREEQLVGPEEMNQLIKESIEQTIGQSAFLHIKLDSWTQNVVEGCLKRCVGAAGAEPAGAGARRGRARSSASRPCPGRPAREERARPAGVSPLFSFFLFATPASESSK